MDIQVSKHAFQRIKERMGLNRKAARRHAVRAFELGISPERYPVKSVAEEYIKRQAANLNVMFLIFNDFVHVYGLRDNIPILITLYDPTVPADAQGFYLNGYFQR